MAMAMAEPKLDRERIAKLTAMLDSPSEPERQAALAALGRELASSGLRFVDWGETLLKEPKRFDSGTSNDYSDPLAEERREQERFVAASFAELAEKEAAELRAALARYQIEIIHLLEEISIIETNPVAWNAAQNEADRREEREREEHRREREQSESWRRFKAFDEEIRERERREARLKRGGEKKKEALAANAGISAPGALRGQNTENLAPGK